MQVAAPAQARHLADEALLDHAAEALPMRRCSSSRCGGHTAIRSTAPAQAAPRGLRNCRWPTRAQAWISSARWMRCASFDATAPHFADRFRPIAHAGQPSRVAQPRFDARAERRIGRGQLAQACNKARK